ncbi:MAG: protoglobin domain-containing protein [Chloroflexota bacterium]|nr:protoglobin domain-containing protein [Chloroflexota bacterium]
MRMIAAHIPGYTYGTAAVATSPIPPHDLDVLKQAAGFTDEDERSLRLAGAVLADQTADLVARWRGVLAAEPRLAQYSLGPNGQPDPHYSGDSGLRFQQWVLDTCLRPYDQDWLNYQQEIALRHTSLKKNKTDGVASAPFIPLRYILAFAAVVNETIKPFLAAKGHPADEVAKMHHAWCKAVQLQMALGSEPYTDTTLAPNEW